ncbi:MAG: prepilin-type N-terminal cleavage/methylation domain-containing protein [Synergistaceae bacterium]|nr:prepilin-type N-terminal cleavage/methylation domain-containing protein [Synergistaceae bacterium]
MSVFGRSRAGFTLIEVMTAVAIAGLVIAGGFKLVTVSLRTLAEVKFERDLVNEAQKVYLDYLTREDMPDRGEKDGVKWRTETDSAVLAGDMELTFRKLVVEYQDREMTLYLPE